MTNRPETIESYQVSTRPGERASLLTIITEAPYKAIFSLIPGAIHEVPVFCSIGHEILQDQEIQAQRDGLTPDITSWDVRASMSKGRK